MRRPPYCAQLGRPEGAAVGWRRRMVRFINHQQIQRGHVLQVAVSAQCLHHGKGGLTIPGLCMGIKYRSADRRIYAPELGFVLSGELIAMGQHAGLGIFTGQPLPGNTGQHDGFAGARRRHSQRILVLFKRSQTALHKQLLTRS